MDDRELAELIAATWWANTSDNVGVELPPAMSLVGARYRRQARAVVAALVEAGALLPEADRVLPGGKRATGA